MNFSFEQLTAFVAAAEKGSFSAAARHLGKAQSVVSTAIANLEIDLGTPLFNRTPRNPILTPAGNRLLKEARLILQRCEHFNELGHALSAGIESSLTLVVDDMIAIGWLSGQLAQFAKRFPSIELELLFAMMDDQIEMVRSNRAQLGLTQRIEDPPDGMNIKGIGSERIIAVAHPAHPLSQLMSVDWQDLQLYRQILVTDRKAGLQRNRARAASDVWWTESFFAVVELAVAQIGWGFIPEHLLSPHLMRGKLKQLPISFEDDLRVPLDLLWMPSYGLGPAGQWLLNNLFR